MQEVSKRYRVSLLPTFLFGFCGIGFALIAGMIVQATQEMSASGTFLLAVLVIGILILFYLAGVYLVRWRKNSFFWDEEGVIVDTKGNKLYWSELADIKMNKSRGKTLIFYVNNFSCKEVAKRIKKKELANPPYTYEVNFFQLGLFDEFCEELMKVWFRHQTFETESKC